MDWKAIALPSDLPNYGQEDKDTLFMTHALALADSAGVDNEVPVGAIVVADNHIIGGGANQVIASSDPSAHAEIVALREAAKSRQNYRLPDATLYVTLEPCHMCLGALIHARIERVVFAATESKAGAVVSHPQALSSGCFNHQPVFTKGILGDESAQRLSAFFAHRRQRKAQLKSSTKKFN